MCDTAPLPFLPPHLKSFFLVPTLSSGVVTHHICHPQSSSNDQFFIVVLTIVNVVVNAGLKITKIAEINHVMQIKHEQMYELTKLLT